MSADRRDRNKASLSVQSLDERLAPTTMSGLGALVAARRLRLHASQQVRVNPASPSRQAGAAAANRSAAGRNPQSFVAAGLSRASAAHARAVAHPGLKVAALPKATAPTPVVTAAPVAPIAQGAPGNTAQAALAKAGPMLSQLYQEYQDFVGAGGSGEFTSSLSSMIRIEGNKVGVDLQASGDLTQYVAALQGLGMQVEVADASHRMVEGLLPIDQIAAATSLPQTDSITPIYRPMTR